MRKPEYLSPTSMSKWASDPNAYYLHYLSDSPPPREPQTVPMAVGSAFDAYVKSYLYEKLFGDPGAPGNDPAFKRDAIFEEQVAKHNRDAARKDGEHCFWAYKHLGALDDILLELGRSRERPQFEMDVRGAVTHGHYGTVQSVPFRVKPDLHYVNEHGAKVILDWKVNGFYSKSGQSPTPGFVRARRSGKMPWTHDDCTLGTHKGLIVNTKAGLEKYNEEWARQCSVGAWVCGAEVGSEFVAIVHQLACRPGTSRPEITVAEHIAFVSPEYQRSVHLEAVQMWQAINSDHVFRHLSFEESRDLCALLDQRKETLESPRLSSFNPALD